MGKTLVAISIFMAIFGVEGWGWFLFVGVIVSPLDD